MLGIHIYRAPCRCMMPAVSLCVSVANDEYKIIHRKFYTHYEKGKSNNIKTMGHIACNYPLTHLNICSFAHFEFKTKMFVYVGLILFFFNFIFIFINERNEFFSLSLQTLMKL